MNNGLSPGKLQPDQTKSSTTQARKWIDFSASIIGLALFVVAVIQLLYRQIDTATFAAMAGFGFLFFKNDSVTEFAFGSLKIKQRLQEAEGIAEAMRELARPLVETLYLYFGTDNLHPAGPTIEGSVRAQLLKLAELAVPDQVTREALLSEMDLKIKQARDKWPNG